MMYHTVRIRDLQPQPSVAGAERTSTRSKRKTSTMSEQFWKKSIKKSSDFNGYNYSDDDGDYMNYLDCEKYRQIYFEANGPHTHLVEGGHALFEAYFAAYNAHEDIVLSPDDIWLMITIYYSRYVDDNAEQMRHLFVDHEGQKELVVEIMRMEPEDFGIYLDGVLPILDQFIRTYKGDVDNDFWDTIFDYTKVGVYGPSGMNRRKVDGLRGWFLRLCYGYHLPSNSDGAVLNKIKLDAVSVPVKLVELPKGGKESSCHVVGGFHGIHSSEDGKHRPIMSFSVFQEKDGK
ncbi:unnamed protein product [Rotaria sordida]|uniref:Uncharacterized protein n=1 Tax=Rotaria sordida TaxID=392033 RepID=A0A815ET37_9BILA|nr:unnamed protein product [Rotaria sordida]CAF1583216.1 unnamed protein product [Rotaria sordida]